MLMLCTLLCAKSADDGRGLCATSVYYFIIYLLLLTAFCLTYIKLEMFEGPSCSDYDKYGPHGGVPQEAPAGWEQEGNQLLAQCSQGVYGGAFLYQGAGIGNFGTAKSCAIMSNVNVNVSINGIITRNNVAFMNSTEQQCDPKFKVIGRLHKCKPQCHCFSLFATNGLTGELGA